VTSREQVRDLLAEYGTTFAAEASISLRDKPAPLYQLLVLTTLSAARISGEIATASARTLFAAGWRTPRRMRGASWQERVDALGRGGYRRYDESTATQLGKQADHVLEHYNGDLRCLRPQTHDGLEELRSELTRIPRIGPTGAEIFCREVQVVWPEVAPYFDARALKVARGLGLPDDPGALAELAPRARTADLAAALVRHG
jgi:hypothetical protein